MAGRPHLTNLEVEMRDGRALDMRIAGHSFQAIGTALGVTDRAVYYMVARALKRARDHMSESADEVITLECQRLDALLLAAWPYATGGVVVDPVTGDPIVDGDGQPKRREPDPLWIDKTIKIMERRARLLGLDVGRLELSGPGGGPVQVQAFTMDLSRLSNSQLRQLEALVVASGASPEEASETVNRTAPRVLSAHNTRDVVDVNVKPPTDPVGAEASAVVGEPDER